jgi:thiamine pyrophosphate-dependent acetolactate synthase large subunit-like protein
MHGGRLVAKALAAHGVRYVFGLCGDHINAIFDGCADEGIPIIDTRHEAAAVQMAQGWSLATGWTGVACVTGGPGLMNAVMPIADAKLAGIPFLVITSAIRQNEVGRGYPQDTDQLSVVGPITCSTYAVRRPDELVATMSEAFTDARVSRGPVVVEIPLDVQLARVGQPDRAAIPTSRGLDPNVAEEWLLPEAAEALRAAERPVAIVGEGAHWAILGSDVPDFAERTGVPIFTMRAGRGLIPDSHKLCFGPPNYLRGPGTVAFPNADVLLVVGTELDIVLMFGNMAPNARLIRIDANGERLMRHKKPDLAIHHLEGDALRQLAEAAGSGAHNEWVKELREAAIDDEPPLQDGAVHPAALAGHVGRAIGDRGSIALDAGALALWAYDRLPATGPGRMLSTFTTPLGTVGAGLPFAMAAKLARPDEPSVALVGDGAFGFSAMELDTAARHGIDVKVVVGNDASWGIVRRQMELGFGRSVAATLADRRYDELARSLGAAGERVDDARELPAALDRLMKSDGPALLDVKLDGSVDHPAMPFIAQMFAPDPE